MKAVLMSIHPKWCAPIHNGLKIIEIRKSKPNLKPPFKAYIYCTKKGGNLVLGDRFDGSSFLTEYTITIGISKERADDTWGVLNGKVIGEFVCDEITRVDFQPYYNGGYYSIQDRKFTQEELLSLSCLSYKDLYRYVGEKYAFGWHITDLVVYDEPKALREFLKPGYKSVECLLDEDKLCKYCRPTGYGDQRAFTTPNGPCFCEGAFCETAYNIYLKHERFMLSRPPQSWCYVEANS